MSKVHAKFDFLIHDSFEGIKKKEKKTFFKKTFFCHTGLEQHGGGTIFWVKYPFKWPLTIARFKKAFLFALLLPIALNNG